MGCVHAHCTSASWWFNLKLPRCVFLGQFSITWIFCDFFLLLFFFFFHSLLYNVFFVSFSSVCNVCRRAMQYTTSYVVFYLFCFCHNFCLLFSCISCGSKEEKKNHSSSIFEWFFYGQINPDSCVIHNGFGYFISWIIHWCALNW